jgi:hypothetical protein
VTEKQHQNHRLAFLYLRLSTATGLHHNRPIAARHNGAHRSQIGPPSSFSSSPSTAAPTGPDLSATHPSTPSSTSLPDRARPSSSSDTPPRPNTTASPSQRIYHLKKKEREADPKQEEIDLRRRESTVLLRFCCFTGHGVVAGAERKRRRSQSRLPCFPVTFAAARESTRRQWRWRMEGTRRHCSYRSRRFPSTVINFWGSVL